MSEIQIIAIHKSIGTPEDHAAIETYRWINSLGESGDTDRGPMVSWILEDQLNHKAYVADAGNDKAYCKVVKNQNNTLFLETNADWTRADNLLALPRF